MNMPQTRLTIDVKISVPVICGAMYPCSNPELVAAVCEGGGIGIVQPISLTYVHGHDFRKGLQYIKSLTKNPFGLNVLTEELSKSYIEKNKKWVDIALEEGCRFFVTALGNPKWIVDKVRPHGGVVYHDVTERKWALKAIENGVNGLICVNNRAGGHLGKKSPEELFGELKDLGLPLICAGGVGGEETFLKMLALGYDGVQMGTRFIATTECKAHADYKEAIIETKSSQIVSTLKLTGVPVSIIRTPTIERMGVESGKIASWMLQHPKLKKLMRLIYSLQSLWKLKRSSLKGISYSDFWQAGKSVDEINHIESAKTIVERFGKAFTSRSKSGA